MTTKIGDPVAKAAQRKQLVARRDRILATARREGRPTTYREDEEIALLKGQIAQIDRRFGRRANPSTAATSTAAQLARLRRTRDLELKNAAGRRRTGNLATAQAMAYAARLRGRR